jgi:hypothetical protein
MIGADKVVHLKWGSAAAAGVLLLLWVGSLLGWPAAIALSGVAVAYTLERYQAIRREGTASWQDMVATAAPFQAVALAVWWLR